MQQNYIDYGARISKKRDYCYKMWHKWEEKEKSCVFILLHPPQILSEEEPPILKKCGRIAHRLGYRGYIAVSLFAYICRVPCDIIGNPVHTEYKNNDEEIRKVLEKAEKDVIAVWGSCSSTDECVKIRLKDRAKDVKNIMDEVKKQSNTKIQYQCFGVKDGHPIALTTDVKKLREFKLD